MKKQILLLAMAAVAIGFNNAAWANVLYDSGTGYAIGIQELFVNGIGYKVSFVPGSFDSIFGTNSPTFLGDLSGADNAANAIMGALNAETTVPEIAGGYAEVLWVPYAFSVGTNYDSFLTTQVGHNTDAAAWQRFYHFSGRTDEDYSDAPYSWLFATFSPVPEPCSFLLLGTGLGIIGIGVRRRTK